MLRKWMRNADSIFLIGRGTKGRQALLPEMEMALYYSNSLKLRLIGFLLLV